MRRLRRLRDLSDGHGSGIAQFAVDNGDEQTVEAALSILVISMVVFFKDGFYFILLHKITSVEAYELTMKSAQYIRCIGVCFPFVITP